METVTLSEARVYVGTYNKYNNGSLFGKWLDLSDYSDKDEFLEACRELHEDEQDPEYMFQDYENIPEALFSESWLSEKFFELRDAIEKLSETQQEAFFVWCDHHNSDISAEDADDLISSFEDGKRLLNYILCIRFFIEVHSIVSASRFFHMPTYLRVVIECQSRFFPFFPAFSRNCPDYFLHTSGSSSFRSLSDLGAR